MDYIGIMGHGLTSGDVVAISKCPSEAFSLTLTLPGTITGSANTVPISTQHIQGPMIEIVWQISDRISSSSKSTGTSAHSSSPSPTGAGHRSTSLSTATKIAIGIVIQVVVIAAIVGIPVFLRRRQKNSQRSASQL